MSSVLLNLFASFSLKKKERIYRKNNDTIDDVRSGLFQYIEPFYNRRRRHSVLGYLSPVMYRQLYDAGKVA
ncbi:MAG: IS3 family transposase [Clostridia bacterium]|nr:IS3 family transposase [Clostridia bacterium]